MQCGGKIDVSEKFAYGYNRQVTYKSFRYLLPEGFLEAGSPLPYLEWVLFFLGNSCLFLSFVAIGVEIGESGAPVPWALLTHSHTVAVIGVWGLRYLTNRWALENSLRNAYMTALLSMIVILRALPHLWPLGIYMHENKENKLSLAFCLLGEIWRNAWPRMPSSLRQQQQKSCHLKICPMCL